MKYFVGVNFLIFDDCTLIMQGNILVCRKYTTWGDREGIKSALPNGSGRKRFFVPYLQVFCKYLFPFFLSEKKLKVTKNETMLNTNCASPYCQSWQERDSRLCKITRK